MAEPHPHPFSFIWAALAKHMCELDQNGFTCMSCFHPDRDGVGSNDPIDPDERTALNKKRRLKAKEKRNR